jgi:hypothetical protein
MMARVGVFAAILIGVAILLSGCGLKYALDPNCHHDSVDHDWECDDPPSTEPGFDSTPNYSDGELSGHVGLPFSARPTAACTGGDWHADVEIVTGSLPPGLRLSAYEISGVPERAGDYYFQVAFTDMTCAGIAYRNSTRNIHIKLTGSSVPQRLP